MRVFVRQIATTMMMVALAGGFATLGAQQLPTVMAQGLDNPRGIAFGPDGMLYVVEAGRGGTSTLCLPNTAGPGTRCYGASGAVTRITSPGVHQRVLTGLPSLAVPSGAEATGPQDIAFGFGRAFITVGSGGDPALLAPFRAQNINFGRLLQVSLQGVITPLVDVAQYETDQQPRADECSTRTRSASRFSRIAPS